MSQMSILLYLLPYEITLVTWSLLERGGPWAWTGFFLTFLIHPILDRYRANARQQEFSNHFLERWGTLLTVGFFPVQVLLVLRTIHLYANSEWSLSWWGAVVSTGLVCGAFGITAAHELVHRKSALLRAVGVGMLSLVNYAHFRVEHVFGHHKTVATPHDPASARKGEMIYSFFVRSIAQGYLSAWRIESRRLKSRPLWQRVLRHRCFHYLLISLILAGGIAGIWGPGGVFFWIFQSLVAVLLLEAVNYIEHYGLSRKQNGVSNDFEPATDRHSWDCDFILSNASLFNLGLHAHHHKSPNVTYDSLRISETAPRMSYGYTVMILISLLPPLWFSFIHPQLPETK